MLALRDRQRVPILWLASQCSTLSHMSNAIPWSKSWASAAILLLVHAWIVAAAASIQFKPASRDIVEARLKRYTGSNKEREATLKQMFAEAGCDGQHLSEQQVKGSK